MTGGGDAERQLQVMTPIVASYAAERFGHEEQGSKKKPFTMNCKQ